MHDLSKEKIIELVGNCIDSASENDELEFKDARGGIPKELWISISAFCNKPRGGIVVFGVREKKIGNKREYEVIGKLDLAVLQEKIISLITSKMRNFGEYSLKTLELKGHHLLALLISETSDVNKPCYNLDLGLPRGAYIRVGNSNRQISEEEMKAFLRYSPMYQYDRTKAAGSSIEMFSKEKIEIYLQKSAEKTGRKFSGDQPYTKVLKNVGLIVDSNSDTFPTVAGFLIFANFPPQDLSAFSRYMIRCVRYSGKSASSTIIDKGDVQGTLDEQIDGAHKFILKNIAQEAKIVGTRRVEKFEYPELALREVVANAIIHRDYMITGTYTHVQVYSDRIEVANPGTLPPGVTIDNLRDSQFSRNEVIARVLRDLDYIEEFGRGIDLIYSSMSDWGLVEPLFKNRSNMFKVTLLGKEYSKLNDRQIAIWHFLQDSPRITAGIAHTKFSDVSRPTINNDLAQMVELGLIETKAAGRNTYYESKF